MSTFTAIIIIVVLFANSYMKESNDSISTYILISMVENVLFRILIYIC